MQIHTQSAPCPITNSINNTLPVHINTKQKRPRPLLMKQPAQPLCQFILKLHHINLPPSTSFSYISTQTQIGHVHLLMTHNLTLPYQFLLKLTIITNILSIYPYSICINIEITTTRPFFMTQPSPSLSDNSYSNHFYPLHLKWMY